MPHQPDTWSQQPWAITKLTNEGRHHIISRYGQRNEAEKYLQFFRRVLPQDTFTLIFDPPSVHVEDSGRNQLILKKEPGSSESGSRPEKMMY